MVFDVNTFLLGILFGLSLVPIWKITNKMCNKLIDE